MSVSSLSSRSATRMWLYVILGGFVFMTNYIDKSVVSVVGPKLLTTYHLSKVQLGITFTAFALSYAFLQPMLASWADAGGPRRVVGAMVGWYGFFTILSGFVAANFTALLAVRVLTGAGEAASMPAVSGGLWKWVPREQRGLVQGVLHAFARVGAAITIPLTVAALLAYGIAGPFVAFGIGTLVVAVLWIAIFRDGAARPAAGAQPKLDTRAAWHNILRSRSMWALCIADFCYFYTLNIYLTWLPTFLVDSRHFSLLKVGIFGALPFIGGAFGGIIGGWICDTLGHRTGNMRLWRRLVPTIGMVCSVALSLPAAYSTNQTSTIILFTASFFMLDATISVFWAIAMDIGGERSSTAVGWMNTWASFGAIVSPLVFGFLVQYAHSWTLPFIVASVLMLIGAAVVWLIDPDERLGAPRARNTTTTAAAAEAALGTPA